MSDHPGLSPPPHRTGPSTSDPDREERSNTYTRTRSGTGKGPGALGRCVPHEERPCTRRGPGDDRKQS